MEVAIEPSPPIAAIIVTFHPDPATIEHLIADLIADEVLVVVIDNGGGRAAISAATLLTSGVNYVDMEGNRGIGAAINAGVALAKRLGVTYLVTFDQDSAPTRGMVRVLAAEFQRQVAAGVKLAAVGPRFVDTRHSPPLLHPFIRLDRMIGSGHRYCSRDDELIKVDMLITSGCLTSIDALDVIGGMDGDIFVDYTDVEWSFRAVSKGFELLGVCRVAMDHQLGHGQVRRFMGLHLFEYSPARRYFYARNTIWMLQLPYVPLRWKVRLLSGFLLRGLTLALAPRQSQANLGSESLMFLRGVLDGLRGRLGPAPSEKGNP
jgi:rhamnosyltransferase